MHEKLNGTREKLTIGLCGDPCYYNKFRELGPRVSTAEFAAICKEANTQTELYGSIASESGHLKNKLVV